jgi:hypothetical protein
MLFIEPCCSFVIALMGLELPILGNNAFNICLLLNNIWSNGSAAG